MKYIDADLLRKEIDRIEEESRKIRVSGNDKEAIGADDKVRLCLKLKSLINSLQQEQQEVDLDKEIEEYWIATEWSKVMTLGKFKVIARYFYGLGQLNSK